MQVPVLDFPDEGMLDSSPQEMKYTGDSGIMNLIWKRSGRSSMRAQIQKGLMTMKYKVILFDADDTLFDFKKSERHAFKDTMVDFGFEYDEKIHLNCYHEINETIWKEFERGEITQQKLKVERFLRLKDKLQAEFDAEEFARKYMHHLSHASFIYPESLELMKKLHGRLKLAIITNGLTDVQTRRIRNAPLGEFFDEIVISEEVRISKPDPEIFSYTLEKLKHHDHESVLMVGDSLHSDIKGGEDYGIDTCWYNPASKENSTEITPTYEIRNLMEILELIQAN